MNPNAPASFGTKSLRISDSVTSGCFSDQTFSKSVINAAGEPGADASIYPTGTLQNHYSASFDIAAFTKAIQPGLTMSVAPDRGDGARMSYVRFEDDGIGWNLFFDDYKDFAPLGSSGNLDNGCAGPDNFIETQIATHLDPTVVHNLRFEMQIVPGPHNDIVQVFVDGVLKTTGTSWEDYYRYCGESGGGNVGQPSGILQCPASLSCGGPNAGTLPDKSRIVRNLLFRTAAPPVAGDAGKGFLIDNVSIATSNVFPASPVIGTATASGFGGVSVTFTPGPDGGYPYTLYTVTCVSLAGQVSGSATGVGSPIVVTGLQGGTPYSCYATETNALGTSGPRPRPR